MFSSLTRHSLPGLVPILVLLVMGEPWQLSSFIPAGAVYAGVQSVLGPAYLGWGLAEGGHNSFYILLGHPHRLRLLH